MCDFRIYHQTFSSSTAPFHKHPLNHISYTDNVLLLMSRHLYDVFVITDVSVANYFYSFLKFLGNITLWFSSSLGALNYILTHTEVTCYKVISNYQKVVEMYFSSTENFLFHFLFMQSTAHRWQPSAKSLRLISCAPW